MLLKTALTFKANTPIAIVISNEQSLVDKCIEEMIESEHPLVFDHNINVQCKYEPIQTNVHLIIDTDLLNLEVCLNA